MAIERARTDKRTRKAVHAAAYTFELLRVVLLSLLAWEGPCKFPAEYSKRVALFERADEHELISSTDYDDHVRWSVFLVPALFCACVAFPLESSRSTTDVFPVTWRLVLQTLIAAVTAAVVLHTVMPVCPSFGTDARPLAFDVDGTTALYLAALSPSVIALADVILCGVLKSLGPPGQKKDP